MIVEPWASVGRNAHGERVRASKNIAYILQQVADADTVLYPLWESGFEDPEKLASVLSAGIAVVFQGGDPSVYHAASFDGAKTNLQDLLGLTEQLLLTRSAGSAPSTFICLAHQLAAAAHILLIKRAVREVFNTDSLALDPKRYAIKALQRACHRIFEIGESLPIVKNGAMIAQN